MNTIDRVTLIMHMVQQQLMTIENGYVRVMCSKELVE